ncbi:MAG: hypothetical protein DMH00_10135 [Acidobacteria bacterium]|nr:MAG: hypothetical protein DMH00_10135 [Acidobacteriota bacterium]
MRLRHLIGFLLLALLTISLAGVLARSQTPAPPQPPATGQTAAPLPQKTKAPVPEKLPKVVRWVCTDRICGGCDGQCSRHGHVATHKGGHCACTPNEGSILDGVIRKAFQGHEKGP